MSEAGHKFLAKLGKKRLRPGGKRVTDWLIEKGALHQKRKYWRLRVIEGLQQLN